MLSPWSSWSESQTLIPETDVRPKNESVLKLGDLSPGPGVYVPEERYRYYKIKLAECDFQTQHPACTGTSSFMTDIALFGAGTLTGLLLYMVIQGGIRK